MFGSRPELLLAASGKKKNKIDGFDTIAKMLERARMLRMKEKIATSGGPMRHAGTADGDHFASKSFDSRLVRTYHDLLLFHILYIQIVHHRLSSRSSLLCMVILMSLQWTGWQ